MARRVYGPAVGRWERLLGRFYFNGSFWYWFPMFGVRVTPRWAVPGILFFFTVFFWVLLPRTRQAIGRNLELVLGPMGWWRRQRRAFRTLHQFAWCLAERYQQFLPESRIRTESVLAEEWSRIAGGPEGVIFVTAHFGGWEMGALVTKQDAALRVVHVVREREANPNSARYLEGLLENLGGPRYVVHYSADEASLGVDLLAALRRGEWVALQGDRPPTDGRAMRVPFLGISGEFPPGPAILARISGAPLVPVLVERLGREHYRLHMSAPIRVDAGAPREASVQAAVKEYAGELEAFIRRSPHQWFCLHDLRARS